MSIRNQPPYFNKLQPCLRESSGFTLLEVMIAVSVIAVALVTLIGAQSQSVSLATGARFDTVASLLAQRKVAELNLAEFNWLIGGEGDFDDTFSGFTWKTEVRELTDGDIGITGIGGMLKVIDLTVSLRDDPARTYTLRTMVLQTIEPES
ncbi:type IV pilus modification PilV family protein [Desulfobulbus alkaliphilus]|uniref:type IV pilus modification PilV family protein n=1 Tax=Desulfobulbus alkaliphilus TaxID=869814 RepID=UPI0019622DC7|nr:prepilin-type N-terminal cleavage/methylation domain-containing protein [Desulfobulbus alkaliphilus]MBM9536054.1 prepilin-type N-terminal cleavage/methylation domain-containing protein [Desulfobulbus alkaliphilus]